VSSLAASASAGRDIGRFSLVSVSPRPLYAPAIVCSHIAMISSTIMHLYCTALHAAFSLICLDLLDSNLPRLNRSPVNMFIDNSLVFFYILSTFYLIILFSLNEAINYNTRTRL